MIDSSREQTILLKYIETKCANIKNEVDSLCFEVCKYLTRDSVSGRHELTNTNWQTMELQQSGDINPNSANQSQSSRPYTSVKMESNNRFLKKASITDKLDEYCIKSPTIHSYNQPEISNLSQFNIKIKDFKEFDEEFTKFNKSNYNMIEYLKSINNYKYKDRCNKVNFRYFSFLMNIRFKISVKKLKIKYLKHLNN
eukprot:Mrub_07689.p1 GENE.Mrub_07689~~Mrub_07689.p1  ORF type:complete len:197 (-),score=14.72 Mrub_07689:62-652(-)